MNSSDSAHNTSPRSSKRLRFTISGAAIGVWCRHSYEPIMMTKGWRICIVVLIENNCFTLPHAVISAFAQVGANCVIGPNASILENVSLADDCHIAAGALISEDIAQEA